MDTEKNLKRNYRVVLTGGPCGGKTTGQSRLCTFFENLGWKVFRVPETATILLSGGIKFSDLSEDDGFKKLDVSSSSLLFQLKSSENKYNIFDLLACFPGCLAAENPGSVAYKFQTHLIRSMIQIENTYFTLAESCNRNCLIICDRGFMDALAYVPSGRVDEIMKENGWNFIDMRDNRYHQILHLVSAANGAEEFYSTEDHAVRSECVEIAKNLDKKSAEAWVGHPYFDVVDNSTDFETKMNKMIEFVCQKLGIDTGDRLKTSSRKFKFLVAELPDDSEFPPFQDFDVVHHYLQTSTPEIQARLRKRGQNDNWSYTHTIRRPHIHGKSVEVKSQLTQRDYSNLLANCDNAHFAIYKKRRCFLMNQYFQLDIYQEPSHSRCKGLILLETYSSLSGDDLKNVLPKFLKIVKDVTGDPDYSMFNLSLREDWNKTDRFSHLMHETRYIAWVPSSSALLTNLQNQEDVDKISKSKTNGVPTNVVNGKANG